MKTGPFGGPREAGTGAVLTDVVEAVAHPRLFHSLGELGLVRRGRVRRRVSEVTIAVPEGGHPGTGELRVRVAAAVASAGLPSAEVAFVEMTPDEQRLLEARLVELGRGGGRASLGAEQGAGAHPGGRHGAKGPTPRPNPFAERSSHTRVLAIGSGKGGVGKSSVSVNLAVALARSGASVAILDADVYGFSVPAMLGVKEPPQMLGGLLLPPVALGVRCISMGFFVKEDQAVVWRGPMLHKALEQFLVDVHWGNPDYLVIDLPPGTGDVSLSIAQFVPRAELYVVTTPQPAAERVASRAALLARQVRLPMRGVIENMSFFEADDHKRYELFGRGGGAQLAADLGVPLLAQLPLVPALREGGDVGRPIVADQPESEVSKLFAGLAGRVVSLGPARVYRSELSVR
ncbi:MAG: Mrp/NBP35 family ATP-binding protein [Acidimicrobiales bacterium]